MQQTKYVLQMICLMLTSSLMAENNVRMPTVDALKTMDRINVDGRLDDPCWQEAKALSGFQSVASDELIDDQTTVHLVYDNKALYVGVKVPLEKDALEKLKELNPERMFGSETIEIFLDPFEGSRRVYQFAINAANKTFESADWVEGWNPRWESNTFIGDTFWSLEVKIPFSSLSAGLKYKRDWGLNIARGNCCWAPTKGFYNQPPLFGKVRGITPPQEYCVGVHFPEVITSIRDGVAEISLMNSSDTNVSVNLQTQISLSSTKTVQFVRDGFVCKPGANAYSIRLDNWPKGGAKIVVKAFDSKTKGLITENNGVVYYDGPFRSAWDRSVYMEEEKAILNLYASQKDTSGFQYEIQITNDSDEEILKKSFAFSRSGKASIELNLTDLPHGVYPVRLLQSNDGITRSFLLDTPLQKVPYKKGTVQYSANGQILRDGKPYFPCGLYYVAHFLMSSPEFLNEYSQAGFNTHVLEWKSADGTISEINIQKQHGVFPIVGLYSLPELYNIPGRFRAPEYWKKASTLVEKVANKAGDGLLFWSATDEPVLGQGHEDTKRLYETIKKVDPYHPAITVNFKPMEFVYWPDATEVFGVDPYPGFPHGLLRRVTDAMGAARKVFKNRPVIAVLQTFTEKGGKMPSPEQVRLMTYLSLIKRANGLLYFSYSYRFGPMKQQCPEVWEELKTLAGEVRELTPVLTWGKDSTDRIRVAQKDGLYARVIEHDDEVYVIVANMLDESLGEIEFAIESGQKNVKDSIRVMFEGRTVKFDGNGWKDKFDAHGVHVYRINMAR